MNKNKAHLVVVLAVFLLVFVSVLGIFSSGTSSMSVQAVGSKSLSPAVQLTPSNFKPSSDYAYIADGSNSITVVNTTDNSLVGNITTVQDPSSVEVTPNGSYLVVLSSSGGGISVIDLNTLKTMADMPTTGNPGYISIAPSGDYVYMSELNSNYIYAYSLVTFPASISDTIPIQVNYDPGQVTFSPNGTWGFVTSHSSSGYGISHNLTIFNAVTNKVVRNISNSDLSNPKMASTSLNGSDLFVANTDSNYITEISLSNYSVIRQIGTGTPQEWVSFDPMNGILYFLFDDPLIPNGAVNIGEFYYGLGSPAIGSSISKSGTSSNASFTDGGKYIDVPVVNPNNLVMVDTTSGGSISSIALGPNPGGITVPSTAYFGVTNVKENGLPYKTTWSVTVGGITYQTNNTSMGVYDYYGTYNLTLSYVNFTYWSSPPQKIKIGFETGSIMLNAASTVQRGEYPHYGYVVHFNQISVFSPNNGSLVGNINFKGYPESMVASPDASVLYVANSSSSNTTISEVSLKTFSVVNTLLISNTPYGAYLSMNPDGKYLYASAFTGNNLTVISTSPLKVVKELNVTYASSSVAFSPNGSIGFSFSENPANYVQTSNNMTIFNAYSNAVIANVSSPLLQDPVGGVISPDGSLLLIANYNSENITAFNVTSMKFIRNISLPGYANDIVFNRNGSLAYVADSYANSNLTVINTKTLTIVKEIPFNGPILSSISISSNGTYAFVSNMTLVGVNLTTYKTSHILQSIDDAQQIVIPATAYTTSVKVDETGLPPSTKWSFSIGNETYTTSESSLTAYSYFGDLSYSSTGSSGFAPYGDGSGQATVDASTGTLTVKFSTPVVVSVSGILNGTKWYLNITGKGSYGPFTDNTSIIDLPYGNYNATISSNGYSNSSLNISVTGSGEHYNASLSPSNVKGTPPGFNEYDLIIAGGSVAGIVVLGAVLFVYFRKRG